MSKQNFWRGFGIGAGIGAGLGLGAFIASDILGGPSKRILRLEKSLQIAKPVGEVFDAWVDFENLVEATNSVNQVEQKDGSSTWQVHFEGKQYEWNAKVEQLIPNQAIGWKSTSGPKHSGRINFSPIGNDTLIHVVMNYAPQSVVLRPFARLKRGHLERFIEKILRDFKTSLEIPRTGLRKRPDRFGPASAKNGNINLATGTMGSGVPNDSRVETMGNPLEFPFPPETKN